MERDTVPTHASLRIAYLCLQATTQGQASYAHVSEIIAGLRAAGHDVTLYEPGYAGGAAPGAAGRLVEFARIERRLARDLRAGAYDALYVRGHALAWPAANAARHADVPVIQECNGPYDDFFAMWPAARMARPLIEHLSRSQFVHAEALIAVTDELASWLARETGRTAHVIGNGANETLFSPHAVNAHAALTGERYAVFFGALSPWQGIDRILDAAAAPEWPADVRLAVVGEGALSAAVAKAQTVNERVVWLGRLPYDQVGGVVAHATAALVLASRPASGLTGSPLKMYEAMACGTPVIVSDVATTAHTVRRFGCGVVLDDESPAGIAAAVRALAADDATRDAMGAAGRAAVEENYTWAERARATERVVREAASRPSDPTITRHQED